MFKQAYIDSTVTANSIGLYQRNFMYHITEDGKRKRKKVFVYYSTEPFKVPITPTDFSQWQQTIAQKLD